MAELLPVGTLVASLTASTASQYLFLYLAPARRLAVSRRIRITGDGFVTTPITIAPTITVALTFGNSTDGFETLTLVTNLVLAVNSTRAYKILVTLTATGPNSQEVSLQLFQNFTASNSSTDHLMLGTFTRNLMKDNQIGITVQFGGLSGGTTTISRRSSVAEVVG